jgi:hypothetical protein
MKPLAFEGADTTPAEQRREAEAEQRRGGSGWRYDADRPPMFDTSDLREAVRVLLTHMLRCASPQCSGYALRQFKGVRQCRAGTSSAEILLCDDCEPPQVGPLASFRWFQPHDLPFAAALRAVLRHLARGSSG